MDTEEIRNAFAGTQPEAAPVEQEAHAAGQLEIDATASKGVDQRDTTYTWHVC